jgi:hypothetical protein
MTQETAAPSNKGHSSIKTMRRFRNFWASVSAVKIEPSASEAVVKAIITGVEGVE